MTKSKRGIPAIVIGAVLIAAAVILLVSNNNEDANAARASEKVAAELEKVIEEKGGVVPGEDPDERPEAAEVSETEKPDYEINPQMEMPQWESEGGRYVALLQIPKLGLSLPVHSEWSYNQLRATPCRYSGSAYTDDLVIAAHNYYSHFGRIDELAIGDEIYLWDMDGNLFSYKVAEVTQLQPTAVEAMVNSEWDLSLFTCNYTGLVRVTVRCERLGKEKESGYEFRLKGSEETGKEGSS